MIALEMRNLGGGEILHACPQESLDKPLPCIVFYHGFTSSKLVYSYFAVALAQAGFRVIMPDAPEHGARYHGDETGRMQPPEETFRLEQALRQSDLAARLTCVWQKGVRHRITPEALATTVAFFQQHL